MAKLLRASKAEAPLEYLGADGRLLSTLKPMFRDDAGGFKMDSQVLGCSQFCKELNGSLKSLESHNQLRNCQLFKDFIPRR
jgi:hypothetical protein